MSRVHVDGLDPNCTRALGSIYCQARIEMVTDRIDGWLIDPRYPEMIANAMDLLFAASPEKLGDTRAAARERARQETSAFRRRMPCQKGDDGSSGDTNHAGGRRA